MISPLIIPADNGNKFLVLMVLNFQISRKEEIEQLLDQEQPDLPRPVGKDIIYAFFRLL